MRPPGRRPGDSGTRDAILTAAKDAFSTQGYTATSLRAVARAAKVDPSLVTYFFDSKAGLYDAAVELPMDPATLVAALLTEGAPGLGERIIRAFLTVWDGAPGQEPMLAMLRGAVSHEDSADRLRALLLRVILRPLVDGIGADHPERRTGLIASQVVGLAMTRYVLRFEPIASASADELAPILGTTLQHYLTDPLQLEDEII